MFLEKLPTTLLTITRDQVRILPSKGKVNSFLTLRQVEQLKEDNVVDTLSHPNHVSFKEFVEEHTGSPLRSVHEILPTYL